jgi:hypothetical protein
MWLQSVAQAHGTDALDVDGAVRVCSDVVAVAVRAGPGVAVAADSTTAWRLDAGLRSSLRESRPSSRPPRSRRLRATSKSSREDSHGQCQTASIAS